ncbi:MAG TPA: MarR family transcriptional regulator [Candidatus Lokiarchaeia archaeon]|nr:MarR family transcriptional regulator [Candidatus Lokiarchaeia archaeon]
MTENPISHEELLQQLMGRIEDQTTITVLYHHAIANKLGLNDTDHKCLDMMIRNPQPLTPSELAVATGLTTGAITGVVDRLEKAGYIRRERDGKDRRRVTLHPIQEKVQEIVQLFDTMTEAARDFLSQYSDSELAFISNLIDRFNAIGREQIQRLRVEE